MEHRTPAGHRAGQESSVGDARLVSELGRREGSRGWLRAEGRSVYQNRRAGEWSKANRVGDRRGRIPGTEASRKEFLDSQSRDDSETGRL